MWKWLILWVLLGAISTALNKQPHNGIVMILSVLCDVGLLACVFVVLRGVWGYIAKKLAAKAE